MPRPAVVSCLLLVLLCAGPAAAKKKLPPQAVLSGTLNEKRDDIQRCAIDNALNQGADKVEILTRVTINNKGQAVNSQVVVTVHGTGGDQVKGCVERVLRSIKFPKIDAPLIHIERTWTIAATP